MDLLLDQVGDRSDEDELEAGAPAGRGVPPCGLAILRPPQAAGDVDDPMTARLAARA